MSRAKTGFLVSVFSTLTLFPIQTSGVPRPSGLSGDSVFFEGPAKIRVRVLNKAKSLLVRGTDLEFRKPLESYSASSSKSRVVHLENRSTKWKLECRKSQVYLQRLGGGRKGKHAFHVEGKNTGITVRARGGLVRMNRQPLRGNLRIFASRKNANRCEVINELDLENYLEGVINAEFNSRWNPESVAAQAVAARTYALFQLMANRAKKKKRRFDVESTIQDQVYMGTAIEDHRASKIVQKTRGIVLTQIPAKLSEDFHPIKAFYHSTCGGRTTTPEKVWTKKYPGFKRGVKCKYCRSSPRFNWQMNVGASDFRRMIEKGVARTGKPKSWPSSWRKQIKGRTPSAIFLGPSESSGRRREVVTVWSAENEKSDPVELKLTSGRLRNWMGIRKFRSTAFGVAAHVDQKKGQRAFQFSGRGHGHGVGLCQWGAKVMGEKGFNMAQILRHYYPDALLRKVW